MTQNSNSIPFTFVGIIPARYASTRFPGKPLAMLGDMTMIERVYRRVSSVLDEVYVATDDERIRAAVEQFGGRVIMTSEAHRSGTDRCREAYALSGSKADVIINIQGDEPFIDPVQIQQIMNCFEDAQTDIATLVRPFDPSLGYDALANPNSPKVVVDENSNALLFSRSVIPFLRGIPHEEWPSHFPYLTHIGMYAYKANVLEAITQLPPSPLEIAESLEQLRWLQGGYTIKTATSTCPTIGIDTPEDLEAAKALLS